MADLTHTREPWTAHWRLFLACGVMILSPFQYGIDFGMIGGLQAMVGFLEVRGIFRLKCNVLKLLGLRLPYNQITNRVEPDIVAHDSGRLHQRRSRWYRCEQIRSSTVSMARLHHLLRRQHYHDDDYAHCCSICWTSHYWAGQWLFYDLFAIVHPGEQHG
jgi:hypothetical protein